MEIGFELSSVNNIWYSWNDVYSCFWPDEENKNEFKNHILTKYKNKSGIYCLSWEKPNGEPNPSASEVIYIGQTTSFRRRLGEFATSSGIFYDERYNGHSAAWRWPQGKYEKMHIAFFPIEGNYPPHLLKGLLHMNEALAIHSYYLKHKESIPLLNANNAFNKSLNIAKLP